MTTTFFLLRHAAHDNVGGYLAGRTPGIRLGADGRAQAGRLGQRMQRETLAAIHASPRERCVETAEAVAAGRGIEVTVEPDLDEVDFGERWQGKDFPTLNADPDWRRWNEVRSLARTPNGERMIDVEARAMAVVERLASRHPDAAVALVSHSEVIKGIVSQVLGLAIDSWSRFDIAPASITTLVIGSWGAKLLTLNENVP
ncbi:MAG TPA: histidine phosphatase family protein [Devosia sp.]|nr:histidine phosphatase family protein [Devosia sp.]